MDIENLKYFNGFGGFTEDGREYVIKVNKKEKTPLVWSNVLANENFGTIVTNNMGGYTWSKNSRLNRITAWVNSPEDDVPSEIIYLKEKGTLWTLNGNVVPDENDYYITYGFGYAKYNHISNDIVQENEIFVPQNDSIKINLIRLKNTTSEKRKIILVYYIKPVIRRR